MSLYDSIDGTRRRRKERNDAKTESRERLTGTPGPDERRDDEGKVMKFNLRRRRRREGLGGETRQGLGMTCSSLFFWGRRKTTACQMLLAVAVYLLPKYNKTTFRRSPAVLVLVESRGCHVCCLVSRVVRGLGRKSSQFFNF